MTKMTNKELHEFCVLLMCCDPWPVYESTQRGIGGATDEENHSTIKEFADAEARRHGFKGGWIEAYHAPKDPTVVEQDKTA